MQSAFQICSNFIICFSHFPLVSVVKGNFSLCFQIIPLINYYLFQNDFINSPFNISCCWCHCFPFWCLKLSMYPCRSCLRLCAELLQSLPSHSVCLSLIFSFCSVGRQMLQGATMQQLQQVQVQSQGTPITVNTHAFFMLNRTLKDHDLVPQPCGWPPPANCAAQMTEVSRGDCWMRSDGLSQIRWQTEEKWRTWNPWSHVFCACFIIFC